MTPLAGDRLLVAEQDRDAAVGEAKQGVGDDSRIETPEDFAAVEFVVLLDPDAVEPWSRRERAEDAVACGQPARRAARYADPQMIVGQLRCPRRGFDERSRRHGNRPFVRAISNGAILAQIAD